MNYPAIMRVLGWVLNFEAAFLTLPCLVAIIYQEKSGFAYLAVAAACLLLGLLLTRVKSKSTVFYAREGFVAVALSWIFLSIFGALPFVISGEIPSFTDALFETISGFTTTGASILSDVEALSRTALFWRSFTHWIGGMGILVFIMAVMPMTGGHNVHLLRAESPGPQVGKLVPKLRTTAKLLYGIYLLITVLEVIFLMIGGMPIFDSLCTTFGTVGTGGFGILNDSFASYSTYLQSVVTIFMIISGINFNVYYLLLIRKPGQALRCEEMRYYLIIIAAAVLMITINVRGSFTSLFEAFHHSAFQVASIITTTGFSTTDFNLWPEFSKTILFLLMFMGACAGSTGGGMKVSRVIILLKSAKNELLSFIHPRSIKTIRFEGKHIDKVTRSSVLNFFVAYVAIYGVSILLVSLDNFDIITNASAVTATFNNIGPGFEAVGPVSNFGLFSNFSKFILMFDMLAGRLEIFPMLLLCTRGTWKKQG